MIEWATDSTGKWTDMQIELKTGNNLAMVPLKGARTHSLPRNCHPRQTHTDFIVITTIDATKETRFVYPCPQVRLSRVTIRAGD